MPPGVVTRMSTVPTECGGAVALICVALTTTKLAEVPPNVTCDAPVKFVPERVTAVFPAVGPSVGETDDTAGGDMNVNPPTCVTDPPAVVTTMSAAPAACAGVVTVSDVALLNVTELAAVPPMVTVDPEVKLVPVMVTDVPPAVGPVEGEVAESEGGAT